MLTIEGLSFGRMRIAGRDYRHDLKIVSGEVVADWWRSHGHMISAEDVRDILDAQPEALVIGSGLSSQMRVDPELAALLLRSGVQLTVLETAEAVEAYNELVERGVNVAGAFHLTC